VVDSASFFVAAAKPFGVTISFENREMSDSSVFGPIPFVSLAAMQGHNLPQRENDAGMRINRGGEHFGQTRIGGAMM
jgi:hypothetical protein